jgi:hypothetical protein
VLACGADASYLGGPLSGLNALRLAERNEVIQLIEDIAERLEMTLEPSASYQEAIELVVAMAKVPASTRADTKKALLQQVKQALDRIEVNSVRISPTTAHLGKELLIDFDITNTLSHPVEVWLGADIEYAFDCYFFVVPQDKAVLTAPGRHTYSRHLTLAAPVTAGSWIVNAGVWLGDVSDSEHSVRLGLKRVDLSIL